jgi:Probable molybdopterin binding domain
MSLRLFSKREIFFRGLELNDVNLDQIAAVVAKELALPEHEVVVVDARADLLTLDVLNAEVEVERIAGRGPALLLALSRIPGLRVGSDAEIHSEGVLGLINLPVADAKRLPTVLTAMERQIRANVARRAIVLPTGSEIIAGHVKDTNTPFLIDLLRSQGFIAEAGPAIADDLDSTIGALTEAGLKGHGLVVTTGGTGAESKDCVVEAIQALDPAAATPYVVHYHRGQGRHSKDGVRLAVGCMELTTYVALTGPHREVRLVAPVMLRGLKEGMSNGQLAEEMANLLRAELTDRHGANGGHW